ncbi:GlsB/YeaQ/YmgE family stress response membrane protein [Secundilactobacillus folii]|uniref:GlsB/YeaQ/YmgE family stress response membrane protein n=1 Tax=Secundilactobacillus folii TaxID=2678357 RepID=A0A7X2XTL9_9LACO|nr:GlsB/YeaQ/YmgE family stress response membrane protein [Secundilactobacillus folii]MTV81424.1 GlsB/YeaQ/YmgE family stress response membrane protein [Secundilactobacillus folii]
MLSLIWTLIIGALIGVIAGAITSRDLPMGWIGNVVGGLLGAWLGESLLGSWGPQLADIAIVPAILGAIIVVLLVSFLTRSLAKTNR